jgi:MFS family permease
MSAPSSRAPLRLLRDPNVAFYVANRFFAAVATSLFGATVHWHVFALTDSTFQLGLVGLFRFLPAIPMGLLAGALADSFDRRRVVLAAQAASLVAALLLWSAAREPEPSLPLFYALVVLMAASVSLQAPARAALLPGLVSRDELAGAVTVASAFQQVAWVLGPVVMGFVIEAAGITAAYAVHAALAAGALVTIALVRPPPAAPARQTLSFESVREGVRFVASNQPVLGSMTLDMFAVVFAGATALLPVYANEILHVGPRGYGLLSAAMEIGAVIMALVLVARPAIAEPGRALLAAVLVFGLATIVFGLSRSFPLSVAAFVIAGMADQVSIVTRATIIQLATPDELRGRVNSVNFIFIGASNQLGAAESGFLAALTSATFSVVFGGFACLGVLAVVARKMPELVRYRTRTG